MRSKEKTLVLLTPAFPDHEQEDYWVPFIQIIVKALKAKFPHIHIIMLAYFYPYKKTIREWHSVKVISFNGMKLNRFTLFTRLWKELKQIKKDNDVAGLFSFWCREGAFIGKWFAKWNKLKHFSWICGQDAKQTNNYVRWISPKPTELIAISDFIAREFEKNHGIKPAHMIPNGIDPDLFPPDFSLERDIDMLAVGSLVQLKRPDILVSIIEKLKQNFPSINAIFCGEGDQKESLLSQLEKAGLNTNIHLVGEKPHKEILQLMQRAKILLHTSSYEGFSSVCLEALYAGAHVVSFTRAMDYDIKNWHIVKTTEELFEKTLELLRDTHLTHERVLVYRTDDNAKKIMQLFGPID